MSRVGCVYLTLESRVSAKRGLVDFGHQHSRPPRGKGLESTPWHFGPGLHTQEVKPSPVGALTVESPSGD